MAEFIYGSFNALIEAPSPSTVYKWKTVEDVMDKLSRRNNKYRIIDDIMYIKESGGDPLRAWDTYQGKFVYLSRADWVQGSPALRATEACVLMRIHPSTFRMKKDLLGIRGKKGIMGRATVSERYPNVFYSLDDCFLIMEHVNSSNMASEREIRNLFAKGYLTYKRTQDGDFIPIWSETI